MTPYQTSHYIEPLFGAFRLILYCMISAPAAFAVVFTGLFTTNVLRAFHVSQPIVDVIFISCAMYFLWAFLISIVDISIDRSDAL